MEKLEDLGAGIKIYQDDQLYKFTSDAILLSEFADVKMGDNVADFCSGSGIVGFNLYCKNMKKIKSVTLFEMQKPLFDLSEKSIKSNNLQDIFSAVNTKVQDIDKKYNELFSLITCNPPYMPYGHGFYEKEETIAVCRTEIMLSLDELVRAISKALKFKGRVCMVHRADRLCDVFCTFRKYNIEPKRLQMVSGGNKEPYVFLVEGVKGGNSGLKILKTVVN